MAARKAEEVEACSCRAAIDEGQKAELGRRLGRVDVVGVWIGGMLLGCMGVGSLRRVAASESVSPALGRFRALDAGWACLVLALSRCVARFAVNASHMSRGEDTCATACFHTRFVCVRVCGFVSVPGWCRSAAGGVSCGCGRRAVIYLLPRGGVLQGQMIFTSFYLLIF